MDLDFTTWLDAFRKLPEEIHTPAFWSSVAQIVWVDLLLAGDNALVIAMACQKLPGRLRVWGMLLGSGMAVLLRIVFALGALKLSTVPFLQLAGGLALIWIAVKLVVHDDDHPEHANVPATSKLWKAVWIIAVADLVMSLDNVVAIVGVSGGNPALIVLGIAAAIPLIFIGAELLHNLILRMPLLVWAGSALLVWIAARMILADTAVRRLLDGRYPPDMLRIMEIGLVVVGLLIVVILARAMQRRRGG